MTPVQPRLLDHPFYQAWTRGEVTTATLASYHRAYAAFIERIPSWWRTALEGAGDTSAQGRTIVREEESHIPLWDAWGRLLPDAAIGPDLQSIISEFDALSPAALLGALQAFEIQQPEVARSKKEGLVQHYGFAAHTLHYFDEHEKEEKHIRFGARLAARVDEQEFADGFRRGAELVYRSLDQFVTCPTA
jgi:pyrroloquinoline-quinone synthase